MHPAVVASHAGDLIGVFHDEFLLIVIQISETQGGSVLYNL